MTESKAMILGLEGPHLSATEASFFGAERPMGFILFARNINSADQVRALCTSLRESISNPAAPIFIDQEGGRVQRLRPPLAPNYPPAAQIGELWRRDREAGRKAAWLLSRLHAFDLARMGLDANCLPVLDVPVEGANAVIGDRAYGKDPESVTDLGRQAIDGLLSGGVLPVMKHIPGHGRAGADSHFALPRVTTPLEELRATDFAPFRALRDCPMAMTAHVVYEAIDPEQPATTSPRVIEEIIRQDIGFDGLLMSDDVSMQALSGDFASRTRAIFAAGCDVVLHCNGRMEEMQAVAEQTPVLAGKARTRLEAALALRARAAPLEEAVARAEFDHHLSLVA